MTNLWMMFYGFLYIGQGVGLIVSLGFWNPLFVRRFHAEFGGEDS